MYVHVHGCVCVWVYCMYTCMCVDVYVRVYACVCVHACLGMFVCVGGHFSFVSKGLSCQCLGLCGGAVATYLEDSTAWLGISTLSKHSHFRMVKDGVCFLATWLKIVVESVQGLPHFVFHGPLDSNTV